MINFVAHYTFLFGMAVAVAYGAGAAAAWRLPASSITERVAFRTTAGLVVLSTLYFLLALLGRFRAGPIAAIAVVAAACSAFDGPRLVRRLRCTAQPSLLLLAAGAVFAGCLVLALYPPTAFDETLYHLPTVRAFAESGRMPFLASLRAPVFPNANEALEVPLYVFAGDIATHLLPLLATLTTALLVFAVTARACGRYAGWIATSIFISSPIIVHLATSGHVEALLTLFLTASIWAFERWRVSRAPFWLWWASLFAGAAASVKYLALFWIVVLAAAVMIEAKKRRKAIALFLVCAGCAGVLLPWYLRIVEYTGNPIFPFAPSLWGHSAWDPVGISNSVGTWQSIVDLIRIPWDALAARGRVNQQPPFSPWFLAAIPVVVLRLRADRRVLVMAGLCVLWAIVWLELPRDSRYLTIVLPLASMAVAIASSHWTERVREGRGVTIAAVVLMLPGFLYAVHRIVEQGPLPVGTPARERYLSGRVPPYRGVEFLNRVAHGETVFVCGGEQLRYFFAGTMLGDYSGLARYDHVLTARDSAELARRLAAFHVSYVLVVPARCATQLFDEPSGGRFVRRYSDNASIVYSLEARSAPPL